MSARSKPNPVVRAGEAFVYASPSGATSLLCLAAKSGSSSWLFALHMAHDEQRFRNGSRLLRTAHGKRLPATLVLMPMARALASHNVARFAIVRHPIMRLLSGWLGKIKAGRGRERQGGWPVRFVPQGPLNETFGAFVRHVVSHPRLVQLNGHFRLQSMQCAGKRPGVLPWRILRIEQVGLWYEDVVCALGLASVVSHGWETFATTRPAAASRAGRMRDHGQACMVRTTCGCRVDCARRCDQARNRAVEHASFNDAYAMLLRYYTPSLVGTVNRWAAPDYSAFHYAPWTFGTDIATAVRPLQTLSHTPTLGRSLGATRNTIQAP